MVGDLGNKCSFQGEMKAWVSMIRKKELGVSVEQESNPGAGVRVTLLFSPGTRDVSGLCQRSWHLRGASLST